MIDKKSDQLTRFINALMVHRTNYILSRNPKRKKEIFENIKKTARQFIEGENK